MFKRLIGFCTTVVVVVTGVLPVTAAPAVAVETVSGIDVSSHQGSVNWAAVRQAGEDFAFVRSGVGNHTADDTFAGNYDRAKAAGLIPGAYHAADPDLGANDAVLEARWFASRLGSRTKGPGELPAVLDLERNTTNMSAAQMSAWTRAFLDELQRLTGKKPIIYTYPSFWETELGDTTMFASYSLWIAHYGVSSPTIPGGWSRHTFWQYTAGGSVNGVSGPVDRNRFNGTLAQLRALAGAPTSFSGLSVISRGEGLLDVFGIGDDGQLKHRAWVRDHWTECWVSIGTNAHIIGEPAAIATRPDRIDVFARGINNHLLHIIWTPTTKWTNWFDADGYITESPAVAYRGATGIDVFARNNANNIIHRYYETTRENWTTNWAGLGTMTATSGPAAIANPDGTLMTVLARGPNGHLHTLLWTRPHGWYNWDDRDTPITGRPTASSRVGNSIDAFLRHNDNSFLHRHSPDGITWNGHPALDFGGYLATSPTSVSWNNQRIDVFARNTNGHVIHRYWQHGQDWSPWYLNSAIQTC